MKHIWHLTVADFSSTIWILQKRLSMMLLKLSYPVFFIYLCCITESKSKCTFLMTGCTGGCQYDGLVTENLSVFPADNSLRPSDPYMRQWSIPSLLQIMACCLLGAKSLSEPILPYCQLYPRKHISVKFYLKFKNFYWRKCNWKCHLRNCGHFVSASVC